MEERKERKTFVGKVVSDKGDKTIIVLIETVKINRIYGKGEKHSKKFVAHDESNQAKIGDVVRIMETRPLSKTKRYRLIEVVEKAVS